MKYNIFGAPNNILGTFILNYNQFVDSAEYKLDYISSMPIVQWIHEAPVLLTYRMSHGFVNHIHYTIDYNPIPPSVEDLGYNNIIRNIFFSFPDMDASGIYFHYVGHDRFDRNGEVYTLGPFNIDKLPPEGGFFINNNNTVTPVKTVTLNIDMTDLISGVKDIFISGDVSGANTNTWIPYSTSVEIELTEPHGKKQVTILSRDNALNESSVSSDKINYGLTRYFFYRTFISDNLLKIKNVFMNIKYDNIIKAKVDNQMLEGSEDGKFRAS